MQRISMSLWREPSSSTPYTMVLLNARLGVSLTLLACFAALTSAQAPAMSPTAATSTESGVTLMIDPWVNRRVYAPVTVPTGSTVQFIWNGDHGVYLLDSSQCPTSFPSGPNELHPVSTETSQNNNYTTMLTAPGVYYFACQVPRHCGSGQMQTITVIDPAPGTTAGLMAVS